MWPFASDFFHLTLCSQAPSHVALCVSATIPLQFFCNGQITFHYTGISHFVYPVFNWWAFRLFPFLAIMNNAAMNIHEQGFVWICIFSSLGFMPRSKNTGSYVNSMLKVLTNWQTIFQNDCTILHFYQQWKSFQFIYILFNTCYYLFIYLFIYLFLFMYLFGCARS